MVSENVRMMPSMVLRMLFSSGMSPFCMRPLIIELHFSISMLSNTFNSHEFYSFIVWSSLEKLADITFPFDSYAYPRLLYVFILLSDVLKSSVRISDCSLVKIPKGVAEDLLE